MAKKGETYEIREASIYVRMPGGDAAISLRGEEELRMFLTLPKAEADKLADQMFACGFGTGART